MGRIQGQDEKETHCGEGDVSGEVPTKGSALFLRTEESFTKPQGRDGTEKLERV